MYFFGILFPIFSVYVATRLRLAWKQGNASTQWPAVQGEILQSESRCDIDSSWELLIRYRYCVHGREYEASTLTFAGYAAKRRAVEAYVARYPVGTMVPVHYDPNEPEVAVLEPGVNRHNFLVARMVLAILFTAGIGCLFTAVIGWRF